MFVCSTKKFSISYGMWIGAMFYSDVSFAVSYAAGYFAYVT